MADCGLRFRVQRKNDEIQKIAFVAAIAAATFLDPLSETLAGLALVFDAGAVVVREGAHNRQVPLWLAR